MFDKRVQNISEINFIYFFFAANTLQKLNKSKKQQNKILFFQIAFDPFWQNFEIKEKGSLKFNMSRRLWMSFLLLSAVRRLTPIAFAKLQ